MDRLNILTLITLTTAFLSLIGCGNNGKLYIKDSVMLNKLVKYNGSSAKITKLKKRITKEKKLYAKIKELTIQEKKLRELGKNKDADIIKLQILEAEYEIGQITLIRQKEGKNK